MQKSLLEGVPASESLGTDSESQHPRFLLANCELGLQDETSLSGLIGGGDSLPGQFESQFPLLKNNTIIQRHSSP